MPLATVPGRHAIMEGMNTVIVGTGPVSFPDVIAVARGGAAVTLSPQAEAEIVASRKVIDALAHDAAPHYGVSTGFGALATRHIPAERRTQLQRSLVRSHAAGSGPEVEAEVTRAMMLLRLSTLATGRTGVRLEVARSYAAMLSAGITPVVREYGSLGCSGDLAPLAHCALAAMGEGTVRVAAPQAHGAPGPGETGTAIPAADALAKAGITPLVLAEKEGLALINGTDGMLGMLVMACTDLRLLLATADITAAMSVEALLGTDAVFEAGLHALRPHPGPGRVRRQHAGAAGRLPHRRQPPRPRGHPGAGRLLAALLAAGARRRAGHGRARRDRRGT